MPHPHETLSALRKNSKPAPGERSEDLAKRIAPNTKATLLEAADVHKLDAVQIALRAGDIATAAKLAKVYELIPVPAQ